MKRVKYLKYYAAYMSAYTLGSYLILTQIGS